MRDSYVISSFLAVTVPPIGNRNRRALYNARSILSKCSLDHIQSELVVRGTAASVTLRMSYKKAEPLSGSFDTGPVPDAALAVSAEASQNSRGGRMGRRFQDAKNLDFAVDFVQAATADQKLPDGPSPPLRMGGPLSLVSFAETIVTGVMSQAIVNTHIGGDESAILLEVDPPTTGSHAQQQQQSNKK